MAIGIALVTAKHYVENPFTAYFSQTVLHRSQRLAISVHDHA
jgi:hypothetical protein